MWTFVSAVFLTWLWFDDISVSAQLKLKFSNEESTYISLERYKGKRKKERKDILVNTLCLVEFRRFFPFSLLSQIWSRAFTSVGLLIRKAKTRTLFIIFYLSSLKTIMSDGVRNNMSPVMVCWNRSGVIFWKNVFFSLDSLGCYIRNSTNMVSLLCRTIWSLLRLSSSVLLSEYPEVKYAAIDALYRKHHEHKIHRFTEKNREKHIANWRLRSTFMPMKIYLICFRVTKYAEEKVAYGINYFLKIAIDHNLFIHVRIHRHKNQDKYDFYALHETFKHNYVTCIFTEGNWKEHLSYWLVFIKKILNFI